MKTTLLVLPLFVLACGHNHAPVEMPPPTGDTAPPPVPVAHDGAVWDVRGHDAIGDYVGNVEFADGATKTGAFTRVIHYPEVTVESDRELWWVWQGTATGNQTALSIAVPLTKADFIVRRNGMMRTAADRTPLAVAGAFTATASGYAGHFAADGINATETWTPSTIASPIFAGIDRTLVPLHDPPPAALKASLFAEFKDYQALPTVMPYVNNPAFQAAVHGVHVDGTDLAFYRAHPQALRVINKVIDPISQLETLARANAFRFTLKDKADKFAVEFADFIDATGMIGQSINAAGVIQPHGDGAGDAGYWVATQAYRYWTTHDPQALVEAERTLTALLILLEITGDPTTFARVLRPAGFAPIVPGDIWHAGTGAYAAYEWMEGGNNDMLKGVQYGYTTGWLLFCKSPGHEALCTRIGDRSKQMADQIAVAQVKSNKLYSNWIAAMTTGDLKYRLAAEQQWVSNQVEVLAGDGAIYYQGIGDWSGISLNFSSFEVMAMLAGEVNLGGNAQGEIVTGINTMWKMFHRQRLAQWNFMVNARGMKDADALKDAILRLQEMPFPKPQGLANHSIAADFVMSPYPSLPWKLDWTTEDRTQALNGYPIFEGIWSTHVITTSPLDYKYNTENIRLPAEDYLHTYWFARSYNLITDTD